MKLESSTLTPKEFLELFDTNRLSLIDEMWNWDIVVDFLDRFYPPFAHEVLEYNLYKSWALIRNIYKMEDRYIAVEFYDEYDGIELSDLIEVRPHVKMIEVIEWEEVK